MHEIFFYQASTVVRLVRAIIEVWGASFDVMGTNNGLGRLVVIKAGYAYYIHGKIDEKIRFI